VRSRDRSHHARPPVLTPKQTEAVAASARPRRVPAVSVAALPAAARQRFICMPCGSTQSGKQACCWYPRSPYAAIGSAGSSADFRSTHTVSLHSRLAELERLEHWQAARDGGARVGSARGSPSLRHCRNLA